MLSLPKIAEVYRLNSCQVQESPHEGMLMIRCGPVLDIVTTGDGVSLRGVVGIPCSREGHSARHATAPGLAGIR